MLRRTTVVQLKVVASLYSFRGGFSRNLAICHPFSFLEPETFALRARDVIPMIQLRRVIESLRDQGFDYVRSLMGRRIGSRASLWERTLAMQCG